MAVREAAQDSICKRLATWLWIQYWRMTTLDGPWQRSFTSQAIAETFVPVGERNAYLYGCGMEECSQLDGHLVVWEPFQVVWILDSDILATQF